MGGSQRNEIAKKELVKDRAKKELAKNLFVGNELVKEIVPSL